MAGVSSLGELCENAGAIIDLILIARLLMRMASWRNDILEFSARCPRPWHRIMKTANRGERGHVSFTARVHGRPARLGGGTACGSAAGPSVLALH